MENVNLSFQENNRQGHYYLCGKDVSQGSTLNFNGTEYFVQKISDDEITLIPETPGLPRFKNEDSVKYTAGEYNERFNDNTARYNTEVVSQPVPETTIETVHNTVVETTPGTNFYQTKADDYQNNDGNTDYQINSDDYNVHDVNQVDRATTEFTNVFGETIHAGEGINHHTHSTRTFNPADMVNNSVELSKLYDSLDEKTKNRLSALKSKGFENLSKNEWLELITADGQHTIQDASITYDAVLNRDHLTNNNLTQSFFKGTKFEDYLKEMKGKNYEEVAKELRNKVEVLKEKFLKMHESLDAAWRGSAADKYKQETIQCIMGHYEVLMANLEDRLEPACIALKALTVDYDAVTTIKNKEDGSDYFTTNNVYFADASEELSKCFGKGKGLLEQLEEQEKELDYITGEEKVEKGGLSKRPEKDGYNRKELEDDLEKTSTLVSSKSTRTETNYYDSLGNKVPKDTPGATSKQETVDNTDSREYKDLRARLDKLLELKKSLDKEIEDLQKLLEAMYTEASRLLELVDRFETNVDNLGKHYNDQNAQEYQWLHNANGGFDVDSIISNHNAIINNLQDFQNFPTISNKSDYHVGDVVLYDDAHGHIYAVTEEFDPLTGELKIACFDRNGNRVGNDVTVWDQREIVPIRGARKLGVHPEYDDIPDTLPSTIPSTKPTGGGDRPTKTSPPTTTPPKTSPPTSPTLTKPPTTTPTTNPPVTSPPETTPQTNPPVTSPPETTPQTNPPVTSPPTTETTEEPIPVIYETEDFAGDPYNPSAPHTGLDSIYGTGTNSQSSAGLGALAGLAAGAAGLGLTGLISDKNGEKEEKDEKNEGQNEVLDNKNDTNNVGVAQNENSEVMPTMPQMF